jgi:hypothetical protein
MKATRLDTKEAMSTSTLLNYTQFVAHIASQPLYDLRVEEFAHLLQQEALYWRQVPIGVKDRFSKYVEEMKKKTNGDVEQEWFTFFQHKPDFHDELFAFRCKLWVRSYMNIAETRKGVDKLRSIWAMTTWDYQNKNKKKDDLGDVDTIFTWTFS